MKKIRILVIYIMKIAKLNRISFKGKIIDSHVHIGKWDQNNYSIEDLDIFIKSNLGDGDYIEKMIVSNLDCIGKYDVLDEIEGNKKLIEIAKNNPKISVLAVCQPHITNGDVSKIEQLFKENPNSFVGLKFHPRNMELEADNKLYDDYLNFAKRYKLPCLFHSDKTFDVDFGNGNVVKRCEFSRPEQIYALAKRHKNVPIILGHMGGNDGKNVKAAIDILVESIEKNTANLFADLSWVNIDTIEKPDIVEAIKRLKNTSKGDKTDRLLFGTDAPLGRYGEDKNQAIDSYRKTIANIKKAIKNAFPPEEADKLIEKIFYKNANDLFFQKVEKKTKFSYKIPLYLVIVCFIGTLLNLSIKNNKNFKINLLNKNKINNIKNKKIFENNFNVQSKTFSKFKID